MTIPFALSFAIGLMVLRGESANLLSVGAIDFGLVVDATVIMVENIYQTLGRGIRPSGHRAQPSAPDARSQRLSRQDGNHIARGGRGQPVDFFRSGDHHRRLRTALHAVGHRGPHLRADGEDLRLRHRRRLDRNLHHRAGVELAVVSAGRVGARNTGGSRAAPRLPARAGIRAGEPHHHVSRRSRLLALAAIFAVRSLGLEFLPKLEEGNLWVRATFPQSVSLEDSDTYVNRMRVMMSKYPEVQTVVSQHGRPDDGTDATGFFNAEFFVPLKPFDTWPAGVDKEKLTQDMTEALAAAVSRASNSIFRNTSKTTSKRRRRASRGKIPSKCTATIWRRWKKRPMPSQRCSPRCRASRISPCLRSLGQPTIRIDVDRVRAARYGLAPGDVNAVVQTAIGGQSAGDLYEGTSDRHFPMMVRLAAPYRQSLDAIRRIPDRAPPPAPATASSRCRSRMSPMCIWCPARRSFIESSSSVTYRSSSACAAAIWAARCSRRSARWMRKCSCPGGYRLEWVGEFGNLQEAISRLSVAVPLSIALIVLVAVSEFQQLARCAARRQRHSHGAARRHFRALGNRHRLQRVLRHRLRRAVWNRRDGRYSGRVVLPFESGIGPRSRKRHAANLPHAIAAGHDDLHRGLRGPDSRGLLDRHRLSGPAAAGTASWLAACCWRPS